MAAYREALKEYTRERVPLDWAMTQNNLGDCASRLGERESGTGRLEEAVAAYREALRECTRERVPLDWAMTQNNLGNALTRLGERESGTGRLEEAVAAYREALQERTRERVPLDWAMTQNNLGNALVEIGRAGERDGAAGRSGGRVSRGAAGIHPRAGAAGLGDDPEQPGNALTRLGERESGTDVWKRRWWPIARHSGNVTRERVPLDWAMTQNNLGNALTRLGRAGERDRTAGRSGGRLSRGTHGNNPRAGAAGLGDDPEQPGKYASSTRRAGERDRAAGRGTRSNRIGLESLSGSGDEAIRRSVQDSVEGNR